MSERRVRPLEWKGWDETDREYARGTIGESYHVSNQGWWHALAPLHPYTSIDEAKAAAQKDYETRILAALI